MLRQQYIDLKRRRWENGLTPTVPKRSAFKYSYSTANYTMADNYGKGGYSPILMYMGPIAEKIRKMQIDSTKTDALPNGLPPRVTSGYRYPKNSDKNSLHQFGYALDMNPATGGVNLNERRNVLLRRIRELIGTVGYDSIIHGPIIHIHIEQQSIAQGGLNEI
ncbi:MAG: hypothetical protein OXH06_00320 [Gemmatimonadetes bacterium]|nr:hypothetical protein [Gemmatimonadota bacterium]